MWILEFCIRKAVGHFKWGWMGHASWGREDSGAESHVDCDSPAQEVSEEKNLVGGEECGCSLALVQKVCLRLN